MSLNIRHMKNDHGKAAYVVFNKGVTPPEVKFYLTKDDVPEGIRHYVPEGEAEFYGPDSARIIANFEIGRFKEVMDYFYPDHQNCNLPKYEGTICVAESCKHLLKPGDWRGCQYYSTK